MSTQKKALVCGAGGFIGGHLVKRLKDEGYFVRGVDIKQHEHQKTFADEYIQGDLREQSFCRQITGDIKFDELYQLAADMGGGDITIKHDPRVLPVGRFLRKTKINELPQLINILIGDMSVVGPRPQTPKNFEYFPPAGKEIILSMRPGLTGIGSIVFRDEESIVVSSGKSVEECYREHIGPYKARLEAWYKERQDIGTYFLLIVVTAWVIIRPKSEIYRKIWPSLPPAAG